VFGLAGATTLVRQMRDVLNSAMTSTISAAARRLSGSRAGEMVCRRLNVVSPRVGALRPATPTMHRHEYGKSRSQSIRTAAKSSEKILIWRQCLKASMDYIGLPRCLPLHA
jgi:hypothetical protein